MTSSLPAGDGISTGTGPSSALDEGTLPDTGTEPDTARTAAGDEQSSASPDVSVAPETSPSSVDAVPAAPDAAGPDAVGPDAENTSTAAGAVEGLNPAEAQDDLNAGSAYPNPSDKVELDGPAVENEEMRRGTQELKSSEDSLAEAREYAADVRSHTLPGTQPTGL